jgi:hypothetical protein
LFPPIASSLNPPVTPKRTPSNLLGNISATVSAKRRRLDNKENMSPPHLVVTSVVERIGMKSPGERGSPVLGKRGSLEQLPEEKVSKRGRIEVLMPLAQSVKADVESGPVEDAALILPSLLAGDFFELQAVTRADDYVGLSAPTRKRKRVVMDAVEVPTWREVKSMRQHSVLPLANARMTREWTQSAATSEGHASLNKRRRRRKRNASHAKNSPSSSPLDLEETINIAGSGKENPIFVGPG